MYANKLNDYFKLHFVDLENINIPVWIVMPFFAQIENVDTNLQNELTELLSNFEEKTLFKNLTKSKF